MNELTHLLFGEDSIAFYVAWFIFSGMGFFLYKYHQVTVRRVRSVKFSFSYFWQDNRWDIIAGFIYTFSVARFKFYDVFIIDSLKDKMLIGFLFGLYYTVAVAVIRKSKLGKYIKK